MAKYTGKDGGFVRLNPDEEVMLEKMRLFDAADRCYFLELTDDDLRNVLAERKASKCQECLTILNSKPRWKDTGDAIVWADVLEYQAITNEKIDTVRKKLRQGSIEDLVLKKLHAFLTNDEEIIYKK